MPIKCKGILNFKVYYPTLSKMDTSGFGTKLFNYKLMITTIAKSSCIGMIRSHDH